jgi:hypothetical protein
LGVQGGELNVLLQLPWVDPDVVKKISRKGGARSVAELMGMGEQERLELLVTSGEPCSLRLCPAVICKQAGAPRGAGHLW